MIEDKVRLQKISDVSWLVCREGNKLGILNKDPQEKYTLIMEKTMTVFDDDKEVKKYFGNDIFKRQIKEPISKLDEFYINGFKVKPKVSSVHMVEKNDPKYREDLPLYIKSLDSKIYYAAGWFSIDYEKAWKIVHGAKLETLKKYKYIGPFSTKEECINETKSLNKKKKEDKKKIRKLKNKLLKLKNSSVKEYMFDIESLLEIIQIMDEK